LVGDGIYFWPLYEIIHGDQNITVSIVVFWERHSDVDCYPLEGFLDVIFVYQIPVSDS
jgi:hypothetical protein